MSCADTFIQASLELLERRWWRLGHEFVSCLDAKKSPEFAEAERALPSPAGRQVQLGVSGERLGLMVRHHSLLLLFWVW